MNSNVAMQNNGLLAWDGAAAYPRDIRRHIRFAWTFEVTAAIAADAVFNIEAAPVSDADPCAPGAFAPVPEVPICDIPAVPAPQAQVIIPAGTPIGTVCSGTIPCRPNAFVRLTGASGTVASVRAVMILNGPMIGPNSQFVDNAGQFAA